MIQQRQAVQETRIDGGQGDDYLEELRNDHLGLVGGSSALVGLRDLIRRVAPSGRPVLISGPTGSGKSLVAEAISRLGAPSAHGDGHGVGVGGGGGGGGYGGDGSLANVNCAEVDEKDLEQILFGNERQAGLLGLAGAATLVLDQVDSLPEGLQGKMVRLLQSGSFRPIGSAIERRVSIRVLAVTSRSLARCVRENTFRADLLYELGVLTVSVPGLDEHRDDIPALVNHFLLLAGSQLRFSTEALEVLAKRNWPGGVRELRNLVERAVIQAHDDVVDAEAIRLLCAPEPLEGTIERSLVLLAERLLDLPIGNKLAAVEAALLESAMRASRGNKSAAARLLGLHRKAVERKLEKYEVRFASGGSPATEPAVAIASGGEGQDESTMGGRPASMRAPREHDIIGRHGLEPLRLHT